MQEVFFIQDAHGSVLTIFNNREDAHRTIKSTYCQHLQDWERVNDSWYWIGLESGERKLGFTVKSLPVLDRSTHL